MKKYLKEFKEFAVKGNVVDLAVAVVIGSAFGKIVSSFVADIIMPPIGVLLGGINFSDIKIILKDAVEATDRVVAIPAVSINIGNFIQNILDFLIVATAVFFMVKLIGRLKTQLKLMVTEGEKKEEAKLLTKDQELLSEIRDLLKTKSDREA